MNNQEKFGNFVAQLRKERGWSQDFLSERLSVDRTTISKWERGIYFPNLDYLFQLQDLFQVTISELLYGERKNNENEKLIDSLSASLFHHMKKEHAKTILFTIFYSIIFTFLFLGFYFLNQYNTVKVYRIAGDIEGFSSLEGIMVETNEKIYIKLGHLNYPSSEKVVYVDLYFKKKGKKDSIVKGTKDAIDNLLINKFYYNELFTVNDLPYIESGLYLEVTLSDQTKKVIPLGLVRDYANNKLFILRSRPISTEGIVEHQDNVPKYIKDNFKYSQEIGGYQREKNSITENYFPETDLYIVSYNNKRYQYTFTNHSLTYFQIINDEIENYFTYHFDEKECFYGECNYEILKGFEEDFLSKFSS